MSGPVVRSTSRNWPYAYSQLGDELSDIGYGVTRLPGAVLGGQSLAVTANSVRSDDARKLIRFLTHERDSQTKLLENGFAPALRDAYGIGAPDDLDCAAPRIVSAASSKDDEAQETEASAAHPQEGWAELLWCALEDAQPRPVTAHYPEFSRTLQREVRQMLDGRSPDEAAKHLHAELPDALSGRH